MSAMTKVFIVLTAVLSIALSCLFIAAAAQWSNWKNLAQKYQELQGAETAQRMNQQAIMYGALAMKDDALQARTQSLDASESQAQTLGSDLADARNELARQRNIAVAAEAGRKKLEEILDVQTAELTALQKQNQTLLTQNIDTQTRNTRLNSRVLELSSNVTILTDQLRNLKEKLYAAEQQIATLQQRMASGRRVAASPTATPGAIPVSVPVAGPIRGEVVEVDGTYASINIGESSGVVPGMTLMVHRGSSFIAELVVDSVRPKEAGGKLRTVQQAVNAGDTVVYGLENAGD
ncbi:MAG: hypothetical protein ABIG44_01980 [Planctomycetota bacterium]